MMGEVFAGLADGEWLRGAGVVAAHGVVWVLVAGGLLLSALSISGTWLVLLASILAAWWLDPGPGGWTVAGFAVACVGVEVLEPLAGSWGVTRRGGSTAAGWAALLGGLAGLFAGTLIPVPVLGSLAGMMAGSFAAVFWWEKRRLKASGQAAHIAWGSVLARLAVIGVKVLVTLVMAAVLLFRVG